MIQTDAYTGTLIMLRCPVCGSRLMAATVGGEALVWCSWVSVTKGSCWYGVWSTKTREEAEWDNLEGREDANGHNSG